jgi:hypothetical protein
MSFLPIIYFIFNKKKTPIQTFMVFGFASVLLPSFAFRENFSYFVLSAQTLVVVATAVLISSPSLLTKGIILQAHGRCPERGSLIFSI